MDTTWLLLTCGAAFGTVALLGALAPRVFRSTSPNAVLVLIVAGAVLGVLAPGAPTRVAVVDAALRGLFGATCAAASATARPPYRLVAAVVVAVPSLLADGGGAVGMLALGTALAAIALSLDGSVIGAAIGLAVGQAALRLEWPRTTGLTALLALVALGVLALPELRRASSRSRRRLLIPVAVIGGVAVVAVGVYAVVVIDARTDVNAGVDLANAGLVEAREGRTVRAARLFERARDAFADAHDNLDSVWAKPVLAVPLASSQARALSRMSAIGVDLAGSGMRTSRAADPEATRLTDGTVALDKIAELEAPLTDALASLRRAGRRLDAIDSTWLVAPIGNKLADLREKVVRATRDADTGLLAARAVPALLGADGQSKRYFVAFQTPAEQRASGGIIGNFAVVDFTDGRLRQVRAGRNGDLNNEGDEVRTLTGPPDYLARYAQFEPQYVWQNVTMSPDWPSVAQVIEGLYPQSGGERVDGAISVDPIALAAFLELTGPVTVAGLDEPLTAENAKRILLRDQYTKFTDLQERVDFLEGAVEAVIDRLQTGSLPGASRVGEVLGPMVEQGRLKVHAFEPRGAEFLTRIGASGKLPDVRGDFVGLVTQNASGNKIELFLDRSLRYEVTVDPTTRTARAVATVTLRNNAPTSGLPASVIAGSGKDPTPPGYYRGYLSLYTPLALQRATVNGESTTLITSQELGRNVLSGFVEAESGATITIRLELAGPVAMSKRDGHRCYALDVWHQPTIEPDHVEVQVRGADGASLSDPQGLRERDGSLFERFRLTTDRRLGGCVSL